jgi:hypothetical protein
MMDDISERFLDAISRLEDVTDSLDPQVAHREFDETSLQVFWKKWPDLAAWAGSLFRMLNDEMAEPARPPQDPELDEVGDAG